MAGQALLVAVAAVVIHRYSHAAPSGLQTDIPFLEYDYSADVEAQEAMLAATTPPPAAHSPRDPLADTQDKPFFLSFPNDCNITSAREMAKLNIMDRILIALGPPFGEKLPKAPTSDTLATVPTPINITTEPCPYKYKRCSSQTYFPSCAIPRNTAPEIWPQRFNLFFNLTADFDTKLDVINATLRLYKNNSLPLQRAKTLLIKAFVYTRSLTRRRNKTKLVADTQVSSDYRGWVTLSVTEMVKRWKRQRNNHGVLITVDDVDNTPWDGQHIFVTMDCASGLVPLPFEVQTEQKGQQYPALNVRLGSPDDDEPESPLLSSSPLPPSTPPTNTTPPAPSPTMQGDDPAPLYDYNYESDLEQEENKEREIEALGSEDATDDEEMMLGVPAASIPPFNAFYALPTHTRTLNPPQEPTQEPPTPGYHHHHHRDHHDHHHRYQTTEAPAVSTTPISRPQEQTTPIPATTPAVLSPRVPSRRRGAPRDMRHRRRNRGHRRG